MTYLKPAAWIATLTLFSLWWMPTIERAAHAISLVAMEMQAQALEAQEDRQGCADGGAGHYDPCECPKAPI